MNSLERLERIKNKYKELLVDKAHTLPFTSNINIENIEEYWHKDNTNDFEQIEKDLEMVDLLKENNLLKHLIDKELFETANSYCGNTNEERERVKQYRDKLNKIKEWLQDE